MSIFKACDGCNDRRAEVACLCINPNPLFCEDCFKKHKTSPGRHPREDIFLSLSEEDSSAIQQFIRYMESSTIPMIFQKRNIAVNYYLKQIRETEEVCKRELKEALSNLNLCKEIHSQGSVALISSNKLMNSLGCMKGEGNFSCMKMQHVIQNNCELSFCFKAHENWIHSVAVSPCNKFIVSGSSDMAVKVWDSHSGELVRILKGHRSIVNAVTYLSNLIASGSDDGKIKIWNGKRCYKTLKSLFYGTKYPVYALSGTRSGAFLASGGYDHTVKIWDVETATVIHTLQHSCIVWSVAYSSDDKTLISGSNDGTAKLWNTQTGNLIDYNSHRMPVTSVAYPTDDHAYSASMDTSIKQKYCRYSIPPDDYFMQSDTICAIDANEQFLASLSMDNTLCIRSIRSSKIIAVFEGHGSDGNWKMGLKIFPNGKFLVTGGLDGYIKIWKMPEIQ